MNGAFKNTQGAHQNVNNLNQANTGLHKKKNDFFMYAHEVIIKSY